MPMRRPFFWRCGYRPDEVLTLNCQKISSAEYYIRQRLRWNRASQLRAAPWPALQVLVIATVSSRLPPSACGGCVLALWLARPRGRANAKLVGAAERFFSAWFSSTFQRRSLLHGKASKSTTLWPVRRVSPSCPFPASDSALYASYHPLNLA